MKLKFCLIVTLILLSISAKADEVILFYLNNSDLSPVRVEVSTVSTITFKTNKLVVKSKDNTTNDFYFSDIRKITFNDDGTFIEHINTTPTLNIYPNPTENELTIEGTDNIYNTDICIYSLHGALIAKYPQWNGEPIDVSQLNPGIYFININSTTLKFVKQ